jgi:hypothetical protein
MPDGLQIRPTLDAPSTLKELVMNQILAMNVAAALTQAACANVGGTLNVSQDLSDPTVRAKNLQVWETFRVFYQAVMGALADAKDWPAPNIPAGNLLPNMIQSLTPLFTGSGPLAAIAGQLLSALIPQPAAVPPAGLPNPGTPTSPPATPSPATAGS